MRRRQHSPRVKDVEQADRIRITGSWSLESGCTAATFVGGVVVVSPAEGALRRVVALLAQVARARIDQAWDPISVAGTGSRAPGLRGAPRPWPRHPHHGGWWVGAAAWRAWTRVWTEHVLEGLHDAPVRRAVLDELHRVPVV